MIRERASAKVNLALHVTGQRADGYHLLDSLVVFAEVGDRLSFGLSQTLSLTVTGPLAEGVPTGSENLVLQAAALMEAGRGARITLDKHLPHAAGIGGGSADTAATLRGLSRLWGCPLPGLDSLLDLGADVPVCVSTAPQRMQGTGEILSPVPPLPPLNMVLANPRVAVPTGPVFRVLSRKDNAPMETPDWSDFASFIRWLTRQRNDLEPPAMTIAPPVGVTLTALREAGAALTRMSGSGATCFGLFESAEDAARAANALQQRHPGWWVVATETLAG